MSSSKAVKNKKGKLEVEIERFRTESLFSKALDLILLHEGDNSSPLYILNQLILCENELDGNEHGEITFDNLTKACEYAQSVLNTKDEQYRVESSILLGKIYFLQSDFKKALNILQSLKLTNIKVENIGMRFARIFSEGLAIMGLCKEELINLKKMETMKSEKDLIYLLYNMACHICIRHLQTLDRTKAENTFCTATLPSTVETVIKKIPFILIQNDDISGAISKFRMLLGYCETPATRSIRQFLALHFAEFLLRGVCNKSYHKYNIIADQDSVSVKNAELVPYRYPANRFIPENRFEEAILALMISEHIASQDVILNRPSESSETQIIHSFNKTAAVYDILTIALIKTGNPNLLSKSLEKGLKFSFHQFHIWHKFALSLINLKQYYRGYLALRECLRIDNSKISIYILASSLCLGHLDLIEEGMELASQAIKICDKADGVFLAQIHLILGWGWSILARACCLVDKKGELRNEAVKEYKISSQLDPDNYLVWYHLAVELATQRHLDDALSVCQQSLQLMPMHSNTLCLLALLHTAGGKRMESASKALRVGLVDRPTDFNLSFLLARIEEVRLGPTAALKIYRRILKVWRDLFASSNKTLFDRVPRSTLSTNHSTLSQTADDVGLSNSASNIPLSFELDDNASLFNLPEVNHLEAALYNIATGTVPQTGSSIVADSKTCRPAKSNRQLAMCIQVKIYQRLAEVYLNNKQYVEAKEALDEATKIGTLSFQTLYLRGCLFDCQGQFSKARSFYESAIALKQTCLPALLSLATLFKRTNQMTLAECITRDAMNVDPTNFNVWRLLAEILGSPGTCEPASEAVITRALSTSIDLEQTEPIEPFYSLPLGVYCT